MTGHWGANTQRWAGNGECLSPSPVVRKDGFPAAAKNAFHLRSSPYTLDEKGAGAKEKACLRCLWLSNCGHLVIFSGPICKVWSTHPTIPEGN